MAFGILTHLSPTLTLLVLLISLLLWLFSRWSQLQHIPGPVFASFSNLPRLLWARTARYHEIQIDLHKKYGKLVRLGPNCVSVGDPQEISKIYGTGAGMLKSNFYSVFRPLVHGRPIPGIFNSQDEGTHRAMRKPISNLYSMTNLVEFEPYVNSTIGLFLNRIDERYCFPNKKVCDMATWLQWLAFDVMGEITFSKRIGFLDRGEDVGGIIHTIGKFNRYFACIGQIPFLDYLFLKNPLLHRIIRPGGSPIVAFSVARAQERTISKESESESNADSEAYNSRDFMSRFLLAREKSIATIPEEFITAWCTSNMQAGSDTTAIFLRAIMYFLLKNPECHAKLVEELAGARREGRLSEIVTWKEARELVYLDAVVKEAGRLHPAVGLALERVVPTQGVELCGEKIPGGTVVGINAWVAHRDKTMFGEDADEFRPERWLVDKEERVAMERCLLTFGSGHRTCLGKNISYLEIYKAIPTLFSRYKMSLQKDWTVRNHWLVVQTNLCVSLEKRADDWAVQHDQVST